MSRATTTLGPALAASLLFLSACCSQDSRVRELRETYRAGTPESEVRRALEADDEIDNWSYYEDEQTFRALSRDVGCNSFREEHIQIHNRMDAAHRVKETDVKVWSRGL